MIRVPFERVEEILADAGTGSMLQYPVTIEREDAFLDALVKVLNSANSVEPMLTCDVGALVDRRSLSFKEHLPRRIREVRRA